MSLQLEAALDRTYWSTGGAWHACGPEAGAERWIGLCGRAWWTKHDRPQTADRVPSNGHLCGSCARVIAARTDIEA